MLEYVSCKERGLRVQASFRIVSLAAALFMAVGALLFVSCAPRNHAGGGAGAGSVAHVPAAVGGGSAASTASPAGIFAYARTNLFFTQSIGRQMGAELAHVQGSADWHWATIARFNVGARQFLMAHGRQTATALANDWSIRELFDTGDLGNPTDSGTWPGYYGTLIGCQAGGNAFVIGQRESDRYWSVQRVEAGGVLGQIAAGGAWTQFYNVAVPLESADHTYIYFQTSATERVDNRDVRPWFIAELMPDGRLNQTDAGFWDDYYPAGAALAVGGESYLFAQGPPAGGAAAPWFIRRIADGGKMGPQTDSGAWADAGATIASYQAGDGKTYLFGQSADKRWFIRQVLPGGTMGPETDRGQWAEYCSFVAPFAFDTIYLHSDDWMAAMSDTIGARKLSGIALPGSHDAGVNLVDYNFANCNRLASSCNTTAQNTDIAGQLALGSRYFDVRPVMEDYTDWTTWRTGHYDTSLLMGCRGEAMSGVFDDVNAFFADPAHAKELAILKISHCFDLGTANGCGSDEYGVLTPNIENALDHLIKCDSCNLLDMTLDQILELGNVIALVDGVASDKPHGIFSWSADDLPVYDNYSDTDNLSDMVGGQFAELENPADHRNQLFLLSWTLTQSTADSIECMFNGTSILSMAASAHAVLFGDIDQWVNAGSINAALYPNIIYLDAFDSLGTRTAIYLNQAFGVRNNSVDK
jgi:hypothetical protein